MEKSGTEPSGKHSASSFSLRTLRSKKARRKSSVSSRRAKPNQKNVVRIKGIPKMTDEDWKRPHYVGLHFYPGKKSVTIRLDADMVKWFKAQGKGWQTKMNWVLRLYFASHRKQGVKVGRP